MGKDKDGLWFCAVLLCRSLQLLDNCVDATRPFAQPMIKMELKSCKRHLSSELEEVGNLMSTPRRLPHMCKYCCVGWLPYAHQRLEEDLARTVGVTHAIRCAADAGGGGQRARHARGRAYELSPPVRHHLTHTRLPARCARALPRASFQPTLAECRARYAAAAPCRFSPPACTLTDMQSGHLSHWQRSPRMLLSVPFQGTAHCALA